MLTRKLTRTSGKSISSTSCDATLQPEFERGVAMLHSYWFIYARKTFEGILQKDPRDGLLGHRDGFPRQHVGRYALAGGRSGCVGRAGEGAYHRRQDALRRRLRLDAGMSGSPIIGSDAAAIALVSTNDGGPIILEMLPVHMARALSVSAPPKMTGAAA